VQNAFTSPKMESPSTSAVLEQPPKTPTVSIHSNTSDLDEQPLPTYSGLFEFTTKKDLIILIPGLFVSVASGLLVPAFTILLGKIFTAFGQFSTGDIAGGELENEIRPFVIGIVIVGAFAWALGWAHMSLWLAFGENTALRARERVIKGLLQKKISWYDLKTVDNGVSGTMNKAVKYKVLVGLR
jgi:ABC transporter transmembrane region